MQDKTSRTGQAKQINILKTNKKTSDSATQFAEFFGDKKVAAQSINILGKFLDDLSNGLNRCKLSCMRLAHFYNIKISTNERTRMQQTPISFIQMDIKSTLEPLITRLMSSNTIVNAKLYLSCLWHKDANKNASMDLKFLNSGFHMNKIGVNQSLLLSMYSTSINLSYELYYMHSGTSDWYYEWCLLAQKTDIACQFLMYVTKQLQQYQQQLQSHGSSNKKSGFKPSLMSNLMQE